MVEQKINASYLYSIGAISLVILITLMASGDPSYFCEDKVYLGIMECENGIKACDESGEICKRCYNDQDNARSYEYCKTGWIEVNKDFVYQEPEEPKEIKEIEHICVYEGCN